ncbi:exo-beta-N-acetylmuramidase NamZ domain-containing protein [Streptomyces sp. TR06-5]|uniref:exo-beta-N-acetylmuramidase NamZ family protein n=1 Tax=unclassified Streptomyces TaxID=2593676 RepID=UPI0039A21E56
MPTRRSLLAGGTAAALSLPLAASAPLAAQATPRRGNRTLVPGADVAAEQEWSMLRGRKVGVISNPTGVLSDARHIVDSMAAREELDIVGVFGPEHGFRGSAQAGDSEDTFTDPRTGLTVYDAYGAGTEKMRELFTTAGADTVVFDIQDVGVRFYTYIWTMYRAMTAARDIGARFVVLDRPNPIGRWADGPLMTEAYTSGVGLKPIVQQHGMTVGELARYFNGELLPQEGDGGSVDLQVVECRGWDPYSTLADNPLPFVPPSPNMPTADTAAVYAGTGYFEGTNLSEGRGTTRPFELVGAPFLDYRWSDRLNALELPGVRFREAYFKPTFSKHTGENCAGVQVFVTDPSRFRPIPTAVAMLVEAHRYSDFAWREDSWDPERPFWIDKLSGSQRLRTMIDDGATARECVHAWRAEVKDFERTRRRYLLYR